MGAPPGIFLIRKVRGRNWSERSYRNLVLVITFIAYAAYHASRKPSSIVKSVLDPDPKKVNGVQPWPIGEFFVKNEVPEGSDMNRLRYSGWAPFNGTDGTTKLGVIDLTFLAFYSGGMFVAGHLGDRLDLRLFLTSGMIGSGIFVGLFGMGYFWDVHAFWYYLVTQGAAGLFQATGWPSVVAVVGNWVRAGRRGLIMGVWNANTSVGNIAGSILAASVLDYGWGWSFILPAAFIFLAGILVYLFLPAHPEDVECPWPRGGEAQTNTANQSASPNRINVPQDEEAQTGEIVPHDEEAQAGEVDLLGSQKNTALQSASANRRSVTILEACKIPGVIPFALSLFFSKLVAYTFMYWLPFYLSQTAIGGHYISVKFAGNLSTLFDLGGITGGILAGYISDKLRARATTAAIFMYLSILAMHLYRSYGNIGMWANGVLMMVAGLFVNGPYALITTAVSADLGTHSSLRGDARALATVTAIIDGTGSVGAALGPLLTGFLSTMGWDAVFYMLMASAGIAGLLLSHLAVTEVTELIHRSKSINSEQPGGTATQPLLGDQS